VKNRLSKHLRKDDLMCKCGCDHYLHNWELVDVIEDIWNEFGEEVVITSGTRCREYNDKVGGLLKSKHLTGEAANIVVNNVSIEELYDYLDVKYSMKYGVGRYLHYVHVDVRKDKGRW
jgi:uncharacterized protein YcbK (DUF882 family)